MRSRPTHIIAAILLLAATVAIAVMLAGERGREPARAKAALAEFLQALEAGDVTAALLLVHSNPRDPQEPPALRAALERQAGAAQLNVAVHERFGEPMPGTDWPLSSQLDTVLFRRAGPGHYEFRHDGLVGSLAEIDGRWKVDLFGIATTGDTDLAAAAADRQRLESLARRVRGGEFASPLEARLAVEPIVIRKAGWTPAPKEADAKDEG